MSADPRRGYERLEIVGVGCSELAMRGKHPDYDAWFEAVSGNSVAYLVITPEATSARLAWLAKRHAVPVRRLLSFRKQLRERIWAGR